MKTSTKRIGSLKHFLRRHLGSAPPEPPSAPRRAARQPLRCAAGAAALGSRHGQSAPLSPTCHANAAPDCPGAAPCAGVAWTASALVRVSGQSAS